MPRYTGQKLNDYMREYRRRNGYKHETARKRRFRDYVVAYKAEKGCADCGERDPIVLDLDHDDPSGKFRGVSDLISGNGCSEETLKAELLKCTVRCANCHRRRTASQQGWYRSPAHQSTS